MDERTTRGVLRVWWPAILIPAGTRLLLHVPTNANYGIFRDEFYYLACADRLAWGYVDHPPLSIALLVVSRALLGDSVHAIRVLPELAGAGAVVLTGVITAQLGGGRFAQLLAVLCASVAASHLTLTGFFSMNAFDLFFWALAFALVVRLINTGDSRLWLALGLVLGLGLLNKMSMLFFAFGFIVGLCVTPHRRMLLTRYFWLGGLIAAAIYLPHILWQVANGWPTLEFMRNAQQYKIASLSPSDFLMAQALEMNPLVLPIWLSGLILPFLSARHRPYRPFSVLYLVLLVFFIMQRSKPYYLAPAYFILFASGGCALEVWLGRHRRTVGVVLLGLIALGGVLLMPLSIPVLPADDLIAYQQTLGIRPKNAERYETGDLPQYFADRFGWEDLAGVVSETYRKLTPAEQAECAVFVDNYGDAGAMEYYGPRLGLPKDLPILCGHNNYYLWGYGRASGKVIIKVGGRLEDLNPLFAEVEEVAVATSPYACPRDRSRPVYVCRRLAVPIKQLWPRVKVYL